MADPDSTVTPGDATASSSRCLLSIVVPLHNEADGVEQLLEEVQQAVATIDCDVELLCVDDGSTDETLARLDGARFEHEMRVLPLSRNFGKEAALMAGLDHARGDAIVFLDGDLQHPPELIPAMVAKWREGYEVVHCTRVDRGREGLLYGLSARLFYRLFRALANEDLRGQTDYKLLDRRAAEALKRCPERNRFFRGLVRWIGFRSCELPLEVRPRAGGGTRWGLRSLIAYSVRNIVSYSSFPLYLIAVSGVVILLLGALLIVQTMYRYLSGTAVTGFTTVILLVILLSGFIILSLGIVSIYLAQLFDEVKRRPTYIVR